LLGVSAVGFFTVTSLWAIVAFVVAFSLGYGIMWPSLQALLTGFGTEQMAGRLLGWFQATFSLSLILGPVLGGVVFDAVAPRAVYAASAGLMVLALVLSIGMQRLSLATAEKPQKKMHMHFHH